MHSTNGKANFSLKEMKYNHQLFDDSTLRSKDRLSKMSSLPENELKSLEISISEQFIKFSDIIQSNDNDQILKEISNLYDLTNVEVTVSNGVFRSDKFIENISFLISNPTFCFSACKLLSRILYITDKFGVLLHELMLPLFHLFIENIQSPDVECIVNALCNLSGDLLYYEFEDDYLDKSICHPLKTIARDIKELENAVSESGYVISYSYIIFIRHVANFALPTENLEDMIEYLKYILINQQVQSDNKFKKVVLWTLYDIMEQFYEYSYSTIIKNDFVPFLVAQMKEDGFLFAEPILGIFYYICLQAHINEMKGGEEEKNENENENLNEGEKEKEDEPKLDQPKMDFDLPCVFSLCLSAPEESIQYEAFQLIHILTECYPVFMYSHDVVKLLEQASESSCPYKVRYQILWIACLLISRHDISFLSLESLKNILIFIINNSIGDEERELMVIQNLQFLKRTMLLERKSDLYEQLIAESGVNGYIDELRDRDNENICMALEIYDNIEKEADSINEACDSIENTKPRFMQHYDDVELDADEVELIQEQNMIEDDDDDEDNHAENNTDNEDDEDNGISGDQRHVPRLTFYYSGL